MKEQELNTHQVVFFITALETPGVDLNLMWIYKKTIDLGWFIQAAGRCNRYQEHSDQHRIIKPIIFDSGKKLVVEDNKKRIVDVDKIMPEKFIKQVAKCKLPINYTTVVCSRINRELFQYFCSNPEKLYYLTYESFETMMAVIYNNLGYHIECTPISHDGGKDIIITNRTNLGKFIYYVECKKNNPGRPLGVGMVRQFLSTIETDRVNGGIIATTSYFSKPAKAFLEKNNLQWRIKLHDINYIARLLKLVTEKCENRVR